MSLDLGEMKADSSAMSIVLDDILESDGSSYFGNRFGAPGAWLRANHARIAVGGAYNTYVNANQTDIPVTSVDAMQTAGYGFIGQEAINWANATTTLPGISTLENVGRGLWSSVNVSQRWGQTYERPPIKGEGFHYHVGAKPFFYSGRRVALYMTTYDESAGGWRPEAESRRLWAGRIVEEINQDGRTRLWTLGAESILKDLETKILTKQPESYVNGINLHGDGGRTFYFEEYNGQKLVATKPIVVPKGKYTHASLAKKIQALANSTAWTVSGGQTVSTWAITIQEIIGFKYRIYALGNDDRWMKIRIPDGQVSHVLSALGFGITRGSIWSKFSEDAGQWKNKATAIFTGKTYYVDYHPLHHNQNGKKLYLYRTDEFWPDQGDDPTGTQACGMIEDVVLDPLSSDDNKGTYFFRYTDVDNTAWVFDLTIDPTLNPYKQEAFCGTKQGDPLVKVKQVYIPKMETAGTNIKRGPFELLLYPLLSTGTKNYNHATYDKCPLPLALGMQSELVDIPSFLAADKAIRGSGLDDRELYVIDTATAWGELLRLECKLFGYAAVMRKGKITLRPILKGGEEEAWTVTLDESTRKNFNDFPGVKQSSTTIINQHIAEFDYNPHTGKFGPAIEVNDVDSILGNRVTKQVKIQHKGIPVHKSTATKIENVVRLQLLGKITRFPLPIVTVGLGTTFVDRVFVGDVVKFVSTTTMDPAGSGSRTISVFATVINVSWDHATHTGSCVLALHYLVPVKPWAPAALTDITAGNGGFEAATNSLILAAHTWGTPSTDPHDGAAVAPVAGYLVRVGERAPRDPAAAQSWGPINAGAYVTATRKLPLNMTLAGWVATREYVVASVDFQLATADQTNGDYASWQANVHTGKLQLSTTAHRYG